MPAPCSFRPRSQILRIGIAAVLWMAIALTWPGAQASAAAPSAQARQAIRSFTLRTATFSYAENAKRVLVERMLTARRSNGTTATVSTFAARGKQAERTVRVIDYTDGRKVQINDALAAKTTFGAPQTGEKPWLEHRLTHPAQNCVFANYENLLRTGTLQGIVVDVVSASFTLTEWRAPELGCEVIQSQQGYPREGSFKLTGETRLVSLKFGEPDPLLFEVDGTLVEVNPSEMLRREAERWGLPWTPRMQEQAELTDKRYLNKR